MGGRSSFPGPAAALHEWSKDGQTLLANPGENADQYKARKTVALAARSGAVPAAPAPAAQLTAEESEYVAEWARQQFTPAQIERSLAGLRAFNAHHCHRKDP